MTPPDKWGQIDRMSGEVAARRASTRAVRAEQQLALALAELAAERVEHERVLGELYERNVRADAELAAARAEVERLMAGTEQGDVVDDGSDVDPWSA